MINLFYAALLCIVQFLPLPCLASHLGVSSNDEYLGTSENVLLDENYNYLPKCTQTYTDFGHSGYLTNLFEINNLECWVNTETIFSAVWSDFTRELGSYSFSYADTNSNFQAYIGFHPFYYYENSYTDTLNWLETNYSGFRITGYKLYNEVYSPWSPTFPDYGPVYYSHYIDFYLANGQIFSIELFKGGDNTYACNFIYRGDSSGYNAYSNCGFFAKDECGYKPLFKVTPYDQLVTDAQTAYDNGYKDGYTNAIGIGDDAGYTRGYQEGYAEGQQDGYQEGLSHADYDSTALTIMEGIVDVGLLPVNVFLMMLNFEVFGVNISGFVSALLTISIVIIIVRFLFGGKSDDK